MQRVQTWWDALEWGDSYDLTIENETVKENEIVEKTFQIHWYQFVFDVGE